MKTNILCYGDSLTAGYSRYGTSFTPYGETISDHSNSEVKSVGMSGWTTQEMLDGAYGRENEDCVGHTADGLNHLLQVPSLNIVCLLAGTNDLGTGVSLKEIAGNMRALVEMCLAAPNSELKVILLTVPPTGGEIYESVQKRRAAVNAAITALAAEFAPRVFLVDAASVLPNPGEHPDEPTAESKLWDNDLLHLSPIGSEKLGRFVCQELKGLGLLE